MNDIPNLVVHRGHIDYEIVGASVFADGNGAPRVNSLLVALHVVKSCLRIVFKSPVVEGRN